MTLTTGFEDSGGARISTLAEEEAFLSTLGSLPNVSVVEVGRSQEGISIRAVGVGGSYPPDMAAAGIFINGAPHGNENAGRDSTLIVLRELALSSDPNVAAYLDGHPVWAIPTVNPSGVSRDSRFTLNTGIDLNRDTLTLQAPESLALARTLTALNPRVVLDLHENINASAEMMSVSVTTAEADPMIRAAGETLNAALLSASSGHGYSTDLYSEGASWPSMLRNAVGLRHMLGIVVEGSQKPEDFTLAERVEMIRLFVWDTIRYDESNYAEIAGIIADAKARAIADPVTSFSMSGANGGPLVPIPEQYLLTPRQVGQFALHAGAFGITVSPEGRVPVQQGARGVIPYLLDARSEYRVVDDTPEPIAPPVRPGRGWGHVADKLVPLVGVLPG